MHSMAAWLLMTLLASTAAAAEQLSTELDDYATAGSEDIYLQPNSGQAQAEDEEDDEDAQYLDVDDEKDEDEDEEEEEAEAPAESLGNNIDAIGLDENSCEFSCPRYYRPVCVSRNDELITYATPCEFFNQLRCANVARQRGKETPTFQLLYHNACKQNTR